MVQIIFDCNIFCKIQASVRLGRGWAELASSGPGPWSVLRSEVSKRRDQNRFYYWNTSTLNFSWEKISNCYFTTPTIITSHFLTCSVLSHVTWFWILQWLYQNQPLLLIIEILLFYLSSKHLIHITNVIVNFLGHPSHFATFNIERDAQPSKQAQKSLDAIISWPFFLLLTLNWLPLFDHFITTFVTQTLL